MVPTYDKITREEFFDILIEYSIPLFERKAKVH